MAKLMINKNKKKVPLHRRSTGIFRNTWADASMKDSMWVRTLKFQMSMGCVQMWWKHLKRLRFRYCAGRVDVLRMNITGKTEFHRKRTEENG